MAVVVDASMAAAWILVDEQNPAVEAIPDQVEAAGGTVVPLFWHEIQNILLKVERRGQGAPMDTGIALRRLRNLRLKVMQNRDDASVMALARLHRLSAYDAAYRDLAIAAALPLATTDRALAQAARREGLLVLGPLAQPGSGPPPP